MGNRVVKFRGKRIDNGDWVVGGYGVLGEKTDIERHIILTTDFNKHATFPQFYFNDIVVIPETVGQYTGLKDKNGVEIYEGDILRNVDNPLVDKLPFQVVWNEHYGAWFWWDLEGEVGTDHLYQSIAEDCEVIGNIHDWRIE